MNLSIEVLEIKGYEKVIEVKEKTSNLHAIIAIHNTTLGPAVGGVRIHPYKNFDDALNDVLRLAKGMTYKAALSNSHSGGGKSVIIADSKTQKTEALLTSFAHAVKYLEGIYYCAEDLGCNADDMSIINKTTKYGLGASLAGMSGNPGRFTARGVFLAMQSTAQYLWGNVCLTDKRIAVQGIGNAGMALVDHLFWNGAKIIVSDINQKVLEFAQSHYNATIVSLEEYMETECDILAPCAMGGSLNSETIPMLKCAAIAGVANNQLLEEEDGLKLKDRGILYAPDYVINSGGLLNVVAEIDPNGYNPQTVLSKVNKIHNRLLNIFEYADKHDLATAEAADQLAMKAMNSQVLEEELLVT